MNNTAITNVTQVASSYELSQLGIMHLKRFWSKALLKRENQLIQTGVNSEWQLDKTLLFALNLGLEQTLIYIYQNAPNFEQFEQWIIDTAGIPSKETVIKFNHLFSNTNNETFNPPEVLSAEQLKFWDDTGYIIIKNAIPKEDCETTIATICNFIEVDRNDPSTWYAPHPAKQGIMVQLFQHPILSKNRQSAKIRMAFEQLWQRKNIWPTTDRVGFNPPETAKWKFPGPDMHWDCSLVTPIPFALQGILYLADTEPEQGAFTLVPGFHKKIETWLNSLPEGVNPRNEDIHALGSKPIAAEAGDFIIWHQALPHGSRPNKSTKPRFVQYITYSPVNERITEVWK